MPENYLEGSVQHSEHSENLKSRIIHLCGEETARQIRLFEKLRIKKAYKIQTLGNYPEESIQQVATTHTVSLHTLHSLIIHYLKCLKFSAHHIKVKVKVK
jgi:hypothetical protein